MNKLNNLSFLFLVLLAGCASHPDKSQLAPIVTSDTKKVSSPDGGAGTTNPVSPAGSATAADSVSSSTTASQPATPTPKSANSDLNYRKDGSTYLLVLKPGQKVMASLMALQAREKLQGANFNAIGAVKNVEVSVYDLQKKAYRNKTFPGSGEVVALTGSMTQFNDQPAIHAHLAVAGPDYKVYGGHLQEAEVSLTLEVFIYPTSGKIQRETNSEFPGVKTIQF